MTSIEDFFKQTHWPEPDVELAEFIIDVQGESIRHPLKKGEPVTLPAEKTSLVYWREPGRYEVRAEFPNMTLPFPFWYKKPGMALYKPYAQETPELTIGEEIGLAINYVPMLFVTPVGSHASYKEALRLFNQNQESWNKTGLLERAQKIKKKRDTMQNNNQCVIIAVA